MNLIKNIEIKNFKSIRHIKIDDCRRINVFIGYPNVGKSNILEAIGLYSCFLLKQDYFKLNDICRIKRFSELFFNKDYRNGAKIRLNDRVLLEFGINAANDLGIAAFDEREQTSVFEANISNTDFNIRRTKDIDDVSLKSVVDLIRKYKFRDNINLNKQTPFALSVPYGENLLDILHRDSKLRKEVAALFEDYGLKLVIDDEEINFLKFLGDDTGVNIGYHLIADTLKRLIFYKAAILSNENSVLLFEEPEAHLFPPYIREFTSDVIFDKSNQFFLATHSPYVLDVLLEEVAEELSVYLVYMENGETRLKLMSEKDISEVREYGVDLFYNLESYLKHGQVNNA